jgi:hypothetical protein
MADDNFSNEEDLLDQINGDVLGEINRGGPDINVPPFTESDVPIISEICFPKHTLILTDQGEIMIDKLNPSIHTISNKKSFLK